MVKYESLLFPVFNYLRRHGIPLGVSEYQVVIETLREGIGVEDVEHLKRLCRLLWAKSQDDQELFDIAFAELVELRLETTFETESDEPERDATLSESGFSQENDQSKINARSTDSQIEQSETSSFKNRTKSTVDSQFQKISPDDAFSAGMSTLSDQLEVEAGTATPEALARQGLSRSRSRRWSSMGDAYLLFHRVKYHLTPRFPLGRREMAEAWRHLRRLQRTGRAEELDVEGTIHSICQTGFFLEPVLQPLRRNQAKLVLLIDQRGSMAPFVPIIRTLVESILRGGLLGKVNIYYFHDCPGKVLYTRQSLTGAIPLEEVLSNQVKDNSILIVSDAGAARGYYDEQRLNTTRRFLKNLHTYTYLYAWLNPIPSKRWQSTTAGIIAQLVPMFSLDRDGLNDAINILRGQPFPPGVNLDA